MLQVVGLEAGPEVGFSVASGDLGEVDGGLGRLSLTEQHAILSLRVRPVEQQLAGDRRDARVAAGAPQLDALTDVVDEGVDLASFTGGVEVDALLL